MNMKKIFLGLFLALSAFTQLQAQENILQIVPKDITAGARSTLNVEMLNVGTFRAFQFDIYLPEGISLPTATPFNALPQDRYPYTEVVDEWEGTTTTVFEHEVDFQHHGAEGFTRFVISPKSLVDIKGNSGTVLTLRIIVDAGLAPGFYPVKIDNIVFSDQNNQAVKSPEIATYLRVGVPESKGTIDFSALTGYMPADVVSATNTWLADKDDVTGLDLTGLSDAGETVTGCNPNLLIYAKDGSDFATKQSADGKNVVVNGTCEELVLTDGHPFCTTKAFTAQTATYSRTVPAGGWYSLCLPFAAETPEGMAVERFEALDATASSVTFLPGNIEAYKPCIFNTGNTAVTFTAHGVEVGITPTTCVDNLMMGTLTEVAAGTLSGCYALKADGSGFGVCGSTTYIPPFRAYLDAPSVAASALHLLHGDDFSTGVVGIVSVDEMKIEVMVGKCRVTAGNVEQCVKINTVDGRQVVHCMLAVNESRIFRLPAGVYLINDKKVLVK